jgi:hypothetical protein
MWIQKNTPNQQETATLTTIDIPIRITTGPCSDKEVGHYSYIDIVCMLNKKQLKKLKKLEKKRDHSSTIQNN